MAGRSRRVVEERDWQIQFLVGAGWFATLGALAITSVLASLLSRPGTPTDQPR